MSCCGKLPVRGEFRPCLKRLDRVDEAALRDLIRAGLEDPGRRWTVYPV
jgi:hypothetical protein